jgi:hypothetical protein
MAREKSLCMFSKFFLSILVLQSIRSEIVVHGNGLIELVNVGDYLGSTPRNPNTIDLDHDLDIGTFKSSPGDSNVQVRLRSPGLEEEGTYKRPTMWPGDGRRKGKMDVSCVGKIWLK